MNKILYTANTDQHINLCHIPYLKFLKEKGNIVHVSTNSNSKIEYCDKKIQIPIHRTPYNFENIKAIFKLKKVIDKEKYKLIITNTPMGSVISRLASISARKKYKTKVIYIAHGFHFFKGCNKLNYILYYPIEKLLSKYTDLIITINEEDYLFAKKHFKTNIEFINGIGFREDKFESSLNDKQKYALKKKIGIKKEDYVISYIAEISKRKRQIYLIKTLKKMNLKNIKILLVGNNIIGDKIEKLIKKYNLNNNVKMLGFRYDVSNILDISNLVISVSKQEGLPLNIMEAMYKEKAIIVTSCRGNKDLIKNNINGIVVPINDSKSLISSIMYVKNNKEVEKRLEKSNRNISKKYSISEIKKEYEKIFERFLNE